MREIDPAAGPRLRTLAEFLRTLKADAGVTYRQMAQRTADGRLFCGQSTLAEAVTGSRLPRWTAVRAYAWAAGDPASPARRQRVEQAYELWRAASKEAVRPRPGGRGRRLREIRTVGQLGEHLHGHWEQSGLSLRLVEMATKQTGHRVPRSTCHLILQGRMLPTNQQLTALLVALGLSQERITRLDAVRDRVEATRARHDGMPSVAEGVEYGCLDGHPAVEAYQDRLRRDEEIKRRTGQLSDDEDYDSWRLERRFPHEADVWDLTDAEIEEMEREAAEALRRAGHTPGALRADLLAIAARTAPAGS